MKYYVVADVHSFYTELIEALTEKGFFEEKLPHKLIVCGDLFDRGSEEEKLQSFIVDLMEKDEVILVRGNHEDLVLEFVENINKWMTPSLLQTHHWSNGTVETVLHLTGMSLNEAYERHGECARKMRETPFFEKIIPAMKNYYETENYIFVHGWIPCYAEGYGGKAYSFSYRSDWRESSDDDFARARWYNGMKAASQGVTEDGKTIVCGHIHTSYGHAVLNGVGTEYGPDAIYSPYRADGIIAIDASAVRSGMVNCIVIED